MKSDIKAVIFDADGTILDTRELIFQAYEHVLSLHGYQIPEREKIAEHGGFSAERTYSHFAPDHDAKELTLIHRAFQNEHLDLGAAYEGLHDLLSKLQAADLKIGVCTSRGSNVLPLLEHAGIRHYCASIVHFEMVTNAKPHPEGLLKICDEITVRPSRVVLVGDTEEDIGAGKAAGVAFSIGITHGFGSRAVLLGGGADHIVDHLSKILLLVTYNPLHYLLIYLNCQV